VVALVDEDTAAFDKIMAAFGLPKGTDEEKAARAAAIEEATLYATKVPLRTMKASLKAFEIARAMASRQSEFGFGCRVGALAARSAVLGAELNVKINAAGLKDRDAADRLVGEAAEMPPKPFRKRRRYLTS
jgi:glutamate formiminotransferase/formiminotetrahydrofolate cyclodeaminase